MKIAAQGARRICKQRIGAAPRLAPHAAPQLRWVTRIALLLLLVCTQNGMAQRTAAADSAWQAGLQAATAAARKVPTGGYVGGAFVSGWAIGFGAPFLFASGAPVSLKILPMTGLGGMIATSQSAKKRLAALPPEVEQELTMHDSAYSTAFRAEYRRTLTSRLQSAQAIGGVTGILIGLGSLAYLVASSISD